MHEKILYKHETFIYEMLALFESNSTNKYDKIIMCMEIFENELWESSVAELELYDATKLLLDYEKIQNIESRKLFLERYIVKKLYSLEI